MAKAFRKEYQPVDKVTGSPVGTPQVFEADTQEELIDKLVASNMNASAELYRTKLAAKVGTLLSMDPDPEVPMRVYEKKVITADERVKLAAALKDPANTDHVIERLLESFGIPANDIREMLQEREINKRQNFANEQAALFSAAHPEFVDSDFNNAAMLKYLNKKSLAFTKKNLEIAYADLNGEGLLTVRAPEQPKPAVQVTPAPAPEPAIPAQAIPAAPISAEPTEVRPKLSSSGLGRDNSSAAPGAPAPKAPEITAQDIARMSSKEYSEKLRDPEFRKLVDNLGRKAASS